MLLGVGHGFVSSGLFTCVGGVLYDRSGTRSISLYKGLTQLMPIFVILFFILCLGNCGAPLTLNFVGEFLSLFGVFERLPYVGLLAGISIVLSAAYTINLFNRTAFGGVFNKFFAENIRDISHREAIILFVLVLFTVILGIYPSIITDGLNYTLSTLIFEVSEISVYIMPFILPKIFRREGLVKASSRKIYKNYFGSYTPLSAPFIIMKSEINVTLVVGAVSLFIGEYFVSILNDILMATATFGILNNLAEYLPNIIDIVQSSATKTTSVTTDNLLYHEILELMRDHGTKRYIPDSLPNFYGLIESYIHFKGRDFSQILNYDLIKGPLAAFGLTCTQIIFNNIPDIFINIEKLFGKIKSCMMGSNYSTTQNPTSGPDNSGNNTGNKAGAGELNSNNPSGSSGASGSSGGDGGDGNNNPHKKFSIMDVIEDRYKVYLHNLCRSLVALISELSRLGNILHDNINQFERIHGYANNHFIDRESMYWPKCLVIGVAVGGFIMAPDYMNSAILE